MGDRGRAKLLRVCAGLPFRIFAGLTVVCMIGAVGVGAFAFISSRHESLLEAYGDALVATVPFGLIALLPAFVSLWLILRGTGADRVIVWLRRFHRCEPSRFPFPKFMSMVGLADVQVATIQDSRFRYSYLTGITRSFHNLVSFMVALMVPACFVGLALATMLLDWLQVSAEHRVLYTSLAATALTLLVFYVIFAPIAALVIRRAGSEVIRDDACTLCIEQWMDRVQSGVGHIFPGLKIFECSDDSWMKAVTTMLLKCDAAIIDISDLNENMRWELSQCTANVRSDKLILAYGVTPENYPADPPGALVHEIEHLIGHDRLQEVIFWPYPEPFSPSRRLHLTPLAEHAMSLLDAALELALDATTSDEGEQLDGEASLKSSESRNCQEKKN